MKYNWRSLLGEPNICGGGHLAAIVFCCDPRKKRCPFRDYALKLLGISKDEFVKVKDEMKVECEECCFKNLAYCCSPEKICPLRDAALKRLGWTLSKYLQYKWEILERLVDREKMDFAFSERVLKQYGMELLELDTQKVYRALGYGNVGMKAVWITKVVGEEPLLDKELREELRGTEFVGARVPRPLLRRVDELVARGIFKSRSHAIRAGLSLLLKIAVKQEEVV